MWEVEDGGLLMNSRLRLKSRWKSENFHHLKANQDKRIFTEPETEIISSLHVFRLFGGVVVAFQSQPTPTVPTHPSWV
ncbi:hypothetical protein ACLOJK_012509 [Asimina triloba]